MTTGKALNGKPYAGNPYVRFDEGEVASAATPRRGSLLYRKMTAVAAMCGATALAITARATDYVTLVTPNLEWKNASSWSDGKAAHSGADYLIALGDNSAMRTTGSVGSSNVETFPGDSLTVGIVGGAKGMIHGKIYNEAHTKYKLLVLANGRYHSTVPTAFWIDGAISVMSPASDPFLLQTHGLIIRVAASISGEAGVQFNAAQTSGYKAVLILSGDNSSYFGKMGVGASDCGILFNSANSVGGALETATPDAFVLVDGAKFGTGASLPAGSTLSRANAGITAASGTVKLLVENDVTFQIPITGSAAVNKTDDSKLSITGAGVVTWDADWTAGNLTVSKGGFFFSPSATVGSGLSSVNVAAGASFGATATQLAGVALSDSGVFTPIGDVTLGADDTVASVLCHVDGDRAGCLTLSTAANVSTWPLPLAVASYAKAAGRYAILKVPTSVRTVTAADFTDVTSAHPAELKSQLVDSLAVETDGDMQVVYYVQTKPFVTQTVAGENLAFSDGAAWDNGRAAYSGAVYFTTGGKRLRANSGNFPNNSPLYVEGGSLFMTKVITANVPDLRLGAGGLCTAASAGGETSAGQFLTGNVTVYAPVSSPAFFVRNNNGNPFTINSTISGSGCLGVKADGKNGKATFAFGGENSGFTGPLHVGADGNDDYVTLRISSKANIGGNPPARLERGLWVLYRGTLQATETLTLDDPNRVVNFDTCFIKVDAGKTLTIKSETIWEGWCSKSGEGVLVMGNTARTGNGKEMAIRGGGFKPLTARTLGNAYLNFRSDSSDAPVKYVVDAEPAEAELAAYGLIGEGDNAVRLSGFSELPIEIELAPDAPTQKRKVPLFTLSATAAANVRGKLVAPSIRKYNVTIGEEEVELDGETRVRFYAMLAPRGLVVVVR